MSDKVFLHYTQAELDRNYDQRGWVKNAEEVLARCRVAADAARARRKPVTLSYGPGEEERLDMYVGSRANAPLLVFVHGGAWRNFTKDDHAFVADGFIESGIQVAVLNFSKLPSVRLPQMVDQVRSAVRWLYRNAGQYQVDVRRIHICGHSSGAHLAAVTLMTDWAAQALPDDILKSGFLISGSYDLEPVVLSARSSYVKISASEREELSPLHHVDRLRCPVSVIWAEHDTDEFRRQSREFATAASRVGRLTMSQMMAGLNHFEIAEALADPEAELPRLIRRQILA